METKTQLKKFTISMFILIAILFLQNNSSNGQNNPKDTKIFVPEIDGEWWVITNNPDLGKYTSPKQQPVDFAVWQAEDGTFQLWSCVRGTKAGGNTRLFYRWEGKNITDKDWSPKGIAMEADTTLGEQKSGLQAPFVLKDKGKYLMFYGDWNRICMAESKAPEVIKVGEQFFIVALKPTLDGMIAAKLKFVNKKLTDIKSSN